MSHTAGALLAATLLAVACGGGGAGSSPAEPSSGPPAPPPSDEGDGAGGLSELDKARAQALADALNQTRAAVRGCIAEASADDFRLSGRVVLAVRFGADGRVQRVDVSQDEVGDAVLTQCLVELYTRYAWPSDTFDARSVLQVPFRLEAPEAQYTIHADHVPVRELADGKLRVQVIMDEQATGDRNAAVSLMTMSGGIEVPLHRHPKSSEILVMLSGEGVLYGLGGKRTGIEVRSGWFMHFPAGAAHAFAQRGDEPVRALQIYAPAGAEQRFEGGDASETVPVPVGEAKKPAPRGQWPIALDLTSKAAEAVRAPELSQLPDEAFARQPVFVGMIAVAAETVVPAHAHARGTEIVWVQAGSATVTIAGEPTPVSAGEFVKIPPGVTHAWEVHEPVRGVQLFVSDALGAVK